MEGNAINETRTLAAFLSRLTFDDLPDDVVETAKMCVLDNTGAALTARNFPWTRMVEETVAESGGTEESSVWGSTLRCSAQQAALVNGTAANGIEMADRVPGASVHPGTHVIPVALAVGEMENLTGRQLLTAVVSGYELGIRIGFASQFIRPGLHQSGHKGVWLGVGAAGNGMGLDPEQMGNAFGIAGSMASGIAEFSQDHHGNMVKRLHAGIAAHNGVLAARLARKGLTGPGTVLEGKFGYISNFIADGHEPRFEELTRDLGTSFRILEREVKPYAAWGGSHVVIDAVGELIRRDGVAASDIKRLRIGGSSRVIDEQHMHAEPKSTMAAQYSLPFLAALTFYRGPEALMDPEGVWIAETLDDDAVLALARDAELYVDPEFERRSIEGGNHGGVHYGSVRITVTLTDGSEHESVVHHSKGTLKNPISRAELQEKFRRLARHALPDQQVEAAIDMIAHLDELDQVSRLGRLLSHQD